VPVAIVNEFVDGEFTLGLANAGALVGSLPLVAPRLSSNITFRRDRRGERIKFPNSRRITMARKRLVLSAPA